MGGGTRCALSLHLGVVWVFNDGPADLLPELMLAVQNVPRSQVVIL